MILKKIDQKGKVNNVNLSSDLFQIWMNEKLIEGGEVLYEGDINHVEYFGNSIFMVINNFTNGIFINTKLGIQKDIGKGNGIILFFDEVSILNNAWNDDYTTSSDQRIDLLNDEVVWEVETYFSKPIIIDNMLFGFMPSKLYRINPETGQSLWHKNLEEYGFYLVNGEQKPIDVQAYIGIYNDVLYFKAGTLLILGVDVNNGKEVFKYEYDQEGWALDNKNVTLDVENGVIFSIGRKNYFEINLSTQVAFQSDHFEQTKEFGVETTKLGGWEGDLIYFWEGSFNTKFGVFRRSSRSIIYAQAVKEAESFLIDVKYGQNKLYIHDRNACLHIFETSDVIV